MPKRPLRVLYSFNNTHHYLLAKSPQPVDISYIPALFEEGTSTANQFGAVSLSICMEAMCRASPETLQDPKHDFSVYAYDPLEEDYAHSMPSTAKIQPRGLPIGQGFLSRILQDIETRKIMVNGTLKWPGTDMEALEVAFSMMATHAMEPPTTARTSTQGKPQKKTQRKVYIDSEKTKSVSSNYTRQPVIKRLKMPELCPESERWMESLPAQVGRPPKKKPSPRVTASTPIDLTSPIQSPSSLPSSPSVPTTQSPQIPSADIVQNFIGLFTSSSNPTDIARNAALLSLMASIDNGNGNGNLIEMLLRSASSSSSSDEPPATMPVEANQDSEIVVLDKENVNPTAFRRRAERERLEVKLLATNPSVTPPTGDSVRGLGTRPRNETTSSAGQTAVLSRLEETETSSRKRRLSDSFDEHDPERGHSRMTRPRSLGDPGSLYRTTSERLASSLKYYSRAIVPGRPEGYWPGYNPNPTPTATASSPVRPVRRPQVKYTVPDWAKTDTATKPRLSEEKMMMVQEEEKRRLQAQKSRKSGKDRARDRPHGISRSYSSTSVPLPSMLPPSFTKRQATFPAAVPMPPVFASGEQSLNRSMSAPVVAIPSTVTASSPGPFRPPFLPSSSHPKTPERRRRSDVLHSPAGSLFTPIRGSSGLSPLFSPSRTPSKREKSGAKVRTSSPTEGHASDGDEFDFLAQEIDQESEDADDEGPPDSIPTPSSDVEQCSSEDIRLPVIESDLTPRKEFWTGLPPSSPLPQSSPLRESSPVNGDERDTSNAAVDTLPTTNGPNKPITFDDTDFDSFFQQFGTGLHKTQDDAGGTNEQSSDAIAEMFQLFGTSELPDFSPDSDTQLSMSPDDFPDSDRLDFEQFWESVKPLAPSSDGQGADITDPVQAAVFADQIQNLLTGCVL